MLYYYVKSNQEVIEQLTLAQPVEGSSNFNKLHVFWDNKTNWIDNNNATASVKFYLSDGTIIGPSVMAISTELINFADYDSNIDLKNFKENKPYKFATITIPSGAFAISGLVTAEVIITLNPSSQTLQTVTLNKITFMVNDVYDIAYDDGLTLSQYNYLLAKISGIADDINVSGTYAFGLTLNTNINGTTISKYKFGSETTESGYTYRQLQYNSDSSVVLEESDIKEYLEFMTGNKTLPVYNSQKPLTILFFKTQDNTTWKYQYVSGIGLRAYKVNFMFATKNYVDTGLATKQDSLGYTPENVANKVTSLSGYSTDTQYPSAKVTWDNLQNIREVAEGKNKSVVLSYDEVAPTDDTEVMAKHYYQQDGITRITSIADYNSYVSGLNLGNELFNSQDSSFLLSNPMNKKYLLIEKQPNYIVVYIDLSVFKTGDNIFVSETNIPDRWLEISGTSSYLSVTGYKLEIAVDTVLSGSSSNPVANSAIYTALNGKQNTLTAGDGIDISNGVIKANVGVGLFLDNTGIHLNNASQNAINAVASKSSVSVSNTGTATDEIGYITIDGVEKKIASGGGSQLYRHSIVCFSTDGLPDFKEGRICFEIICSRSTAFTSMSELQSYIPIGDQTGTGIPCNGTLRGNASRTPDYANHVAFLYQISFNSDYSQLRICMYHFDISNFSAFYQGSNYFRKEYLFIDGDCVTALQ